MQRWLARGTRVPEGHDVPSLTFDQLTTLHDDLTDRLAKGEIDLPTYIDEWDNIVSFSGWDQEGFAAQVDLRWDPQKKALSPVFRREASPTVFRC
jgi:hypothetical protein